MTFHNNRVALVTGGARGLDAESVERLAANGARVAFTYTEGDSAGALAERIELSGGKVLSIRADSTDAAGLARAVEETIARFGRLDIFINGGGTSIAVDGMSA